MISQMKSMEVVFVQLSSEAVKKVALQIQVENGKNEVVVFVQLSSEAVKKVALQIQVENGKKPGGWFVSFHRRQLEETAGCWMETPQEGFND